METSTGGGSWVRQAWWDYAACVGQELALFYGSPGELPTERKEREARAKRICRRCPARPGCLAYALAQREAHGIWGGLSPAERAARRRRRRPGAVRGGGGGPRRPRRPRPGRAGVAADP
nr:WhiB family transcriptional regulator [Spiractinospora alimapuensis]